MINAAKFASLLFVMMTLSFGSHARETVAIIDHNDIPVMTGSSKPVTSEQVRDAISAAATSLRWDVSKSPSQDMLSATLLVRGKHTVVVSIPYSAEKFSIKYQNSINMKYELAGPPSGGNSDLIKMGSAAKETPAGTPTIHPAYNKWVQELRQAIQAQLRKL